MIKVIHISESGQHPGTDIYIGKGYRGRKKSPLSNPYPLYDASIRSRVVNKYAMWLRSKISRDDEAVLKELDRIKKLSEKGQVNLVCFCAPKLCHGDIIKECIEQGLHTDECTWYPVVGFEGIYEVSHNLKVRRLKGYSCLKQRELKIYWRTSKNSSRKVPAPTVCLSWEGRRFVRDVRKLRKEAIEKYRGKFNKTT